MTHWTIDRLKPLPVTEALAKTKDFDVIQAKRDGYRLTLFVDEHGHRYAYGREVREDLEFLSRFPKVSKLVERELSSAPRKSIFDGELYVPGCPASDVTTAIRGGNLELKFEVFAVPVFNGKDFRPLDVMGCLKFAHEQCGFDVVPTWRRDHPFFASSNGRILDRLKDVRDAEGFVLKKYNYSGWFKLKQESTVDCVIVGWEEGDYYGELGSLEVAIWDGSVDPLDRPGAWDRGALTNGAFSESQRFAVDGLKTVANVSGMDDATREQMTTYAECGTLIGRVVEVQYQYVGAQGRFRHPRFKRWREDKPKWECELEN